MTCGHFPKGAGTFRSTDYKIEGKKRLYFEAGAVEVWICDAKGAVHFFGPETTLKSSALVLGFPKTVEI